MRLCPICLDASAGNFKAEVGLVFGAAHDLVECPICGAMRFEPLPSTSELKTFYSAAYYTFDRSGGEGKGRAFSRKLRALKEKGRFLDVGCATGFFMNGIRAQCGWEVYGTDFGESAVRFARETLHLDVRRGDLSDAGFPDGFFDYVYVNNVLEHVLDPVSLLKECRRVIAPDGTMRLSVPNGFVDSLDLIDFYEAEQNPARSKNGHIFFFPARTLLLMIERAGFAVEKSRTYGFKRGMRSIGCLPRKRDWKKDYHLREAPEIASDAEIDVPDSAPRHSDFYYRFRSALENLQMLPGLHTFGLDFLFLLKPR